IVLSDTHGGGGTNYGASCDQMTIFDDHATNPIGSGTPPFLGAFVPDQPLSELVGKRGSAINGVWTFVAEDLAFQDVGTLQCWSLKLVPFAPLDGGGQCLVGPSIVKGPSDQSLKFGDTAQFTVQAQGTSPLAYQWYFNQTQSLTYATNATLVLSNVTTDLAG